MTSAHNGPHPSPAMLARTTSSRSVPKPAVSNSDLGKNDPSQWGVIDDDGTVYLITDPASGKRRAIGQWQAGSEQEGLAHFGSRFDGLVTKAMVLRSRVSTHPEEAATIRASAQELRTSLAHAAVLGDVAALANALDSVTAQADDAEKAVAALKEEARDHAIAAKENLASEAETIAAESTNWKPSGDRLHGILTQWKALGTTDQTTDDALWRRFSRAREAFNRSRGAHFASLDAQREEAKMAKESLVEEAVALQSSTEWALTTRAYRELMDKWKAAGRAPRDDDDRLWQQFQAARDVFFHARDENNARKDEEFAANAAAKDALLAHFAPQINPEANLQQARAKLAELQAQWDAIGFVPRDQVREYEDKIKGLEQKVADAEESQWRRNDPEAIARVEQFESRAVDLQRQADQARAKGNDAKADKLAADADQWRQWAETAKHALDGR